MLFTVSVRGAQNSRWSRCCMRLGAPRDPPGAAKEAHDDTMGAQNDAKGLAKVLLASHADLMVRQGRPLELPEEAPCHPRTPPSTKTQQKPMVFQCFSIRHIALPRHLPSATGPLGTHLCSPRRLPALRQGPQDEPKASQGPPPSPPRSSSESPELAQGRHRQPQEPYSGLRASPRPPKGPQVSPKT